MNNADLQERTFHFARHIIHLYSRLPHSILAQTLGEQVLRSGTSVGANYREATRARSKAEFTAKVGDSLKELEETAYWLELLGAEKLISPSIAEKALSETDELIAIFCTIQKRSRSGL